MAILTPDEIAHISRLLIDPDPTNCTLAKTLLEPCYPTALPQMADRAALYSLFHPEDVAFHRWMDEVFDPTFLVEHPFFWLTPQSHASDVVPLPAALEAVLPFWRDHEEDLKLIGQLIEGYDDLVTYLTEYLAEDALFFNVKCFLLRRLICQYEKEFLDYRSTFWYENLRDLLLTRPKPEYFQEIDACYERLYNFSKKNVTLIEWANFHAQISKQPHRALALYQKALDHSLFRLAYYEPFLELSLQQNRPDWLLPYLEQALQLESWEPHNRCQLHHLAARLQWEGYQEAQQAIEHYQKALYYSRKHYPSLRALGDLLVATDSDNGLAQAAIYYEKAIDEAPNKRHTYLYYGDFLETYHAYKQAIDIYRRASYYCSYAVFPERIAALEKRLSSD